MESLIEACNVTDAKEVYEILGQEKIEISIQLKQDYLEMLCFHNSNDEEMEEDFNETKGIINVNQNKWIAGKYSHLFNKRGGWNKRGGGAKVAKSLNVEGGIFWKKLVHTYASIFIILHKDDL